MAEVFLFVTPSVSGSQRAAELRYLTLREESVYGAISSLGLSVMAFSSLSARTSGRNQQAGRLMPGGQTGNLQISTPMLFDGRYQLAPVVGGSEIISSGQAQRALYGVLFKRRADPDGEPFHPGTSLGDLTSWNVGLSGPNAADSRIFKGVKTTGLTFSSAGDGNSLRPWTMTAQTSYYGSESSTFEGDLPTHKISPRLEMSQYFLQCSTFRITEEEGLPSDSMLSSIVPDVSDVRIQCRRRMTKSLPFGAVDATGVALATSPQALSEEWTVRFSAPAWRAGPIANMVEQAYSGEVRRKRYNLRIDIGGVSNALYRALPDSATTAIHESIWSVPYEAGGEGAAGAKVFAIYARDATTGGASQYVPLPGDRIRFPEELGGFVATVGDARLVEGSTSAGYSGPNPLSEQNFLNAVGSPWGDCPRPQGHVSMWFTDLAQDLADNNVSAVPMGMRVEMDGLVLTGSEGLDNRESRHDLQLSTDTDTKVRFYY